MILQVLDANKAEDIVTVNLTGKSALTDYMIVASGLSARHVGALAQHIREHLEKKNVNIPAIEGIPQNDWVLIDAGDAIVHLFRPEIRTLYNIEEMWGEETPAKRRQMMLKG